MAIVGIAVVVGADTLRSTVTVFLASGEASYYLKCYLRYLNKTWAFQFKSLISS